MPARLITADVVQEAIDILDQHIEAAIGVFCGEDLVSTDAYKLAQALGLVDASKPPAVQTAYNFGVFLAHLDQASGVSQGHGQYGATTDDFLAAIRRHPIPRLDVEIDAAHHARSQAARHLRGLGNKVGARLGSSLIEADDDLARFMRQQVNDAISARYGDPGAQERMRARARAQGKDEGFYDGAYRNTIKRVRSDMGHLTNDWSRDWDRIAQTETQTAVNRGMTDGWNQQERDQAKDEERPVRSLLVYKVPRPGACKHCLRLHLEGGYPRIYTLDEVEGNGINIGRSAADWLIVVGATHPYCACHLHRLPKFIQMPKGWRSGSAAPSIVDTDGRLA